MVKIKLLCNGDKIFYLSTGMSWTVYTSFYITVIYCKIFNYFSTLEVYWHTIKIVLNTVHMLQSAEYLTAAINVSVYTGFNLIYYFLTGKACIVEFNPKIIKKNSKAVQCFWEYHTNMPHRWVDNPFNVVIWLQRPLAIIWFCWWKLLFIFTAAPTTGEI